MQGTADPIDELRALITANAEAIERLEKQSEEAQRRSEEVQKWNDRQWDAIKFVGTITTSLTIAATVALVGVLLRLGSL